MTSLSRLAVAAALLLPLPLHAVITFQRTYGGSGIDRGYSVQQTTDGGFIIAGTTVSSGALVGDAYLIKTDDRGTVQWTKTVGGTDDDGAYSVIQTVDGGFVATGYTDSYAARYENCYLIKTDAGGETTWTRTFGDTIDNAGASVQQTYDGGFVVACITWNGADWEEKAYLVKAEVDGDTQWTRKFALLSWYGISVRQTADSGYIIAGGPSSSFYLLKTNAGGDSVWTKTYVGGVTGQSICLTTDGGYIVAGERLSAAPDADVYLAKTDAAGDTQWTRTYGGADDDRGCSVLQTTDGGYAIAGSTMSFGAGLMDVYLVKTDSSGEMLWARTFGGSNYDMGEAVWQTADGGYAIAGSTESFGAGAYDVYLIKTDSLGIVAVAEPEASPTRAPGLTLTSEPNPTTGRTTIRLSPFAFRHSPPNLRVFDSQGRLVHSALGIRASSFRLDLGSLPAGAYFLRLDAGSKHATARLVLQR